MRVLGRLLLALLLALPVACAKLPQDVAAKKIEDAVTRVDTPIACREYLSARADYEAGLAQAGGLVDNSRPPLQHPFQRIIKQVELLQDSEDPAVSGSAKAAWDALNQADEQQAGLQMTALAALCEERAAP